MKSGEALAAKTIDIDRQQWAEAAAQPAASTAAAAWEEGAWAEGPAQPATWAAWAEGAAQPAASAWAPAAPQSALDYA